MVAQGCMWGLFAAASCTDIYICFSLAAVLLSVSEIAKSTDFWLVSEAPSSLGAISGMVGRNSNLNQRLWVSICANYLATQWVSMNNFCATFRSLSMQCINICTAPKCDRGSSHEQNDILVQWPKVLHDLL